MIWRAAANRSVLWMQLFPGESVSDLGVPSRWLSKYQDNPRFHPFCKFSKWPASILTNTMETGYQCKKNEQYFTAMFFIMSVPHLLGFQSILFQRNQPYATYSANTEFCFVFWGQSWGHTRWCSGLFLALYSRSTPSGFWKPYEMLGIKPSQPHAKQTP